MLQQDKVLAMFDVIDLSAVILYFLLFLVLEVYYCSVFLPFTRVPSSFGVDARVRGLYMVWDQLRQKKNGPRSAKVKWDRNSPGRDWKGEKLIWQLFLLTLLMFPLRTKQHQHPPHHHHRSKKKILLQRFFCSATLPPLFKSTSPNTPSVPVAHADLKPNFLSPEHFLLCNTQSQVCFSRGVGNGEGWHNTWIKWGPCQCIFMTCQSEAHWGSGSCLKWNRRCWWPYTLQTPLGIILASIAILSWVSKARVEKQMTATTLIILIWHFLLLTLVHAIIIIL